MTIYLDNAATSFPKPEVVYQAMDRFARSSLANPGRSGHRMAREAEDALKEGRHRLNQLFNGRDPDRFVFTLNCTDALNMGFKGVLRPGDHVITSDLEHNSVSRPLRALELANVIALTRVKADGSGTLNPEDIQAAITSKTRLIAVGHASNVLGTIQPVTEIGRIAKERNVLFLVDAAQTAGVVPVDVREMNIDLLALPGHKGLMGPTGTGALFVASSVEVAAWREGGTGGDSKNETQPKEYPYFLEGGTPNILGVAGLTAGIQWVLNEGLSKIHDHETMLLSRLWEQLEEISDITVYGHRDLSRRVGTLSFSSKLYPNPYDLGNILDGSFEIAIRPGLHCAPYIHKSLGTFPDGTVRVSPGPFNTEADVDRLAGALREILS